MQSSYLNYHLKISESIFFKVNKKNKSLNHFLFNFLLVKIKNKFFLKKIFFFFFF
jgi:hypothetical protein